MIFNISNCVQQESTEKIAATPTLTTNYRDTVLSQHSLPKGIDPRVIARVGIRAQQFIIDFPAESGFQKIGQAEIC